MQFENVIRPAKYQQMISWDKLDNRVLLLTGATGLIGSTLICFLADCCKKQSCSFKIIAVVRDLERAQRLFAEQLQSGLDLTFLLGDVERPIEVPGPVDYIVHAASQTASQAFVQTPVETIRTALTGTENLLRLAAEKQVTSMVYLSSMEVYGAPDTDRKITEQEPTDLDTMAVRNSYPESKRMCESLCAAYAGEYHVPVKVLRLTQTFGPGVKYQDKRVFAEFARCAIEGRDIVLHTLGKTKRNYLFTQDAATAILVTLLSGSRCEAYNAANEATYCSIYEMAQLVAQTAAESSIQVRCEVAEDLNQFGYAPTLHMNLDTSKLRALGWEPQVGLLESYQRMIRWMREQKP